MALAALTKSTFNALKQSSADHRGSLLDNLVKNDALNRDTATKMREQLASWPDDRGLVSYLLDHHLTGEDDINRAFASVYHIPFVVLPDDIDPEVMKLLPEAVCGEYKILPFKLDQEKTLHVALADPLHIQESKPGILSDFREKTGYQFNLEITTESSWQKEFAKYPGGPKEHHQINEPITLESYPDQGSVDLKDKLISYEIISKLPQSLAERYHFVVFAREDKPEEGRPVYQIAAERPEDARLVKLCRELESLNKIKLKIFSSSTNDIEMAQDQYEHGIIMAKNKIILSGRKVDKDLLAKIPSEVAVKYRFIAFEKREYLNRQSRRSVDEYFLATDQPIDQKLSAIFLYICRHNRVRLSVFEVASSDLDAGLRQYDSAQKSTAQPLVLKVDSVNLSISPEKMRVLNSVLVNQDNLDRLKKKELDHSTKPNWWHNFLGFLGIKTQSKEAITKTEVVEQPPQAPLASPAVTVTVPPPPQPKVEPVPPPVIEAKPLVVPEDKEHPPEAAKSADKEKKEPTAPGVRSDAEIAQATNPQPAEDTDLGSLLDKDVETIEELEQIQKDGFVPKLVAAIVSYAITLHASDIHIEAGDKDVRIRYRVDGMLQDILHVPFDEHAAIISRIKILSKLKIDETRIPQDGRFDVKFKNREVDLRVSCMPMSHGEKIVMRILDKTHGIMSLEELGVVGYGFDVLTEAIKKPFGIILSTGPTGSGKSTTLYAILNRISTPTVNVITLEDPVEYEIAGVNQSQIKPKIGYTFAEGLRSVLRQDPNIIMVGEIRDGETASMATQAALTGHLVLSTLHTNDAPGALPRLINMGIEPFLIASSINVVEAQRLVRKICQFCKEEVTLPPAVVDRVRQELDKIPKQNQKDIARIPENFKFHHGKGCSKCQNGYHGRIGIYEVMPVSQKIEELAVNHASANDIQKQAIEEGMITMEQDGLLKVLAGLTTVDEVLRETSE